MNSKSQKVTFERFNEVDRLIKTNCNLIPINNWNFDEDIRVELRQRKHSLVDDKLTSEQKKNLSNASKQRLARNLGAECRTVTDVLDFLSLNHKNTKPLKANLNIKLKNSKRVKAKKIISKLGVEEKCSNIDLDGNGDEHEMQNETKPDLKVASCSVNSAKLNNLKRKRSMQMDSAATEKLVGNDENEAMDVSIAKISNVDLLEGRKIAMQKLQKKIEQLKSLRQGKKTAFQYQEQKKLRRRMSKLKMKQRKGVAKQSLVKDNGKSLESTLPCQQTTKGESSADALAKEKPIIYSKFDFIVRDEGKKESKKEKRDKFKGKDYKRLIIKAEKRNERLEAIRFKNPEKAANIEGSIQWKKALDRAEGKKVKDDPELLKKGLQKKEKLKEWRTKKWVKRTEHANQMQSRKLEKRVANIQSRKDVVKKKKMQKLRKKGRIL